MAETHDEDKQLGDEEEEEYVLLELDDCLYCDIQPNDPYVLPGLDTLNPTLVVGDGPKMIGEYEETVGTCYLFSESDAPPKPIPDETTPSREQGQASRREQGTTFEGGETSGKRSKDPQIPVDQCGSSAA